jgi:hypothetical protein
MPTFHPLPLLATSLLLLPLAASGQSADVTVTPADSGEALCNPGMGWVFHHYDNVPESYGSRLLPEDTLDDFPGLTVIYLRIPWSYLEPEEGHFNWSTLDTPAQRWLDKGKQIALRISCSESWTRWATPEWVQKAGAKGVNFRPGQGVCDDGPFWEPDYDDPVFLEKLDHFVAALARRYDGSPEVAFVDVGSFGVWGEGHTWASSLIKYPESTLKRHIDLYTKHFRHTLLAANDDYDSEGRSEDIIRYSAEQGLTLRDDSILVQGGANAYFHANLAPLFWDRVPVILESEHYGGSRDRGNWQDGSLYLKAVEDYRASYVSIHWWPHEFLAECRDLIGKINLRLGYRLQLTRASWPASCSIEGRLRVATTWRNAGVAPCLPGGYPTLTLKNARGGTAAVLVDDSRSVCDLPVGPPGEAPTANWEREFDLPFNMASGDYEVFVSVGALGGTPSIALPLPGDDGHHRYPLGRVRVSGDYEVSCGALAPRDGQWLLPLTWRLERPAPATARPFCHFDREGQIAFQADPPDPFAGLGDQAGEVQAPVVFTVPEAARGLEFSVRVGLWCPDRLARPNERLRPGNGDPDRRVTLGTLAVAGDGALSFTPATR